MKKFIPLLLIAFVFGLQVLSYASPYGDVDVECNDGASDLCDRFGLNNNGFSNPSNGGNNFVPSSNGEQLQNDDYFDNRNDNLIPSSYGGQWQNNGYFGNMSNDLIPSQNRAQSKNDLLVTTNNINNTSCNMNDQNCETNIKYKFHRVNGSYYPINCGLNPSN